MKWCKTLTVKQNPVSSCGHLEIENKSWIGMRQIGKSTWYLVEYLSSVEDALVYLKGHGVCVCDS